MARARSSTAALIAKEREALERIQTRIAKLKEEEGTRMLAAAERAGYFDVEVSDEALEAAFAELVERARRAAPLTTTV